MGQHLGQVPRLARPDPRQQHQHPRGGDLVAGILRQPQEGQQVLDVGRLHELQAAVLVKGNLAGGQLGLQQDAVVRGPEEHRLAPQVDPLFAMREDAADQVCRLVLFVLAGDQRRPLARRPLRPEVLGEPLAGQADHVVGGLQDRQRAAIVLLQGDQRGAGIVLGKVEDVVDVGRPEGIDRLGVVAHHGQPLALGREEVKDLGLQGVGVLILVDQHAIELLAHRRPGLRIGQQGVPVEQQVVVVQHGGGLLAVHVAVQQPLQLVGPIATPGELAGERLLQLFAGVDAAAVDRHAGPLLGEPLVGLGQAQLGADDVEQVLGIGAVVDGEIGRQSDGLSVAAQSRVATA